MHEISKGSNLNYSGKIVRIDGVGTIIIKLDHGGIAVAHAEQQFQNNNGFLRSHCIVGAHVVGRAEFFFDTEQAGSSSKYLAYKALGFYHL